MFDTIIDRRYKVLNAVGGGKQALVYQAIDMSTGSEKVAIKRYRLPNSLEDRKDMNGFGEYEALIYQQLAAISPSIAPRCLAMGYDCGMVYLVLDFLSGQTLREYGAMISSLPSWDLADLVQLMLPLARSLAVLHSYGIFHRDLKPENIMLLPDRTIRIVDWSIAYSPAYHSKFPPRARDWGTVGYCPPEINDAGSWTTAYDAFCFGRMLEEFARCLSSPPPVTLSQMIAKLTKRFPANRPPLALVAQQLKQLVEDKSRVPIATVAAFC